MTVSNNAYSSDSSRCRAFTALEALVMLLALFILTMLGVGLWKKKGKEEAVIEQPAPQNTIGVIKTETSKPDKEQPSEKPEGKTKPQTEQEEPELNKKP